MRWESYLELNEGDLRHIFELADKLRRLMKKDWRKNIGDLGWTYESQVKNELGLLLRELELLEKKMLAEFRRRKSR